jgi:hypothetical protein
VTDDSIHALVHCGGHGQHECIADLKCQACGRKVSVRFGTALYRLKTESAHIAMVLTALGEGVCVAVAARIFGHSEFTIQTWLTRAGQHAQSLHERLLHGLHLAHLQLDEVRTAIRQGSQIVWVWIAMDARSKLVAAMHIGPRTQDMAHALVRTLKDALAPDCIPVFTSDGLMLYFYALTSYFGQWIHDAYSRARRWQVCTQLLYGQVKQHDRRRRIQRVEHRAVLGSRERIRAALLALGFAGTIQRHDPAARSRPPWSSGSARRCGIVCQRACVVHGARPSSWVRWSSTGKGSGRTITSSVRKVVCAKCC